MRYHHDMVSAHEDTCADRHRLWDLLLRARVPAAMALVLALVMSAPYASAHDGSYYVTAPRERPYTLTLTPDGRAVLLRGRIFHGVTRELDELLQRAEGVDSLHLQSAGGLVSEARGLVVTVRRANLDTVAVGDCLSVCTLVLMSGEKRYLADGARLGFHAYRLVGGLAAVFIDAEAEQQRDMDLFRDRDVSEEFIARVIATPHDGMWYPSPEELLDERLVDALVIPPDTQSPLYPAAPAP